jgi:hypothetical protein
MEEVNGEKENTNDLYGHRPDHARPAATERAMRGSKYKRAQRIVPQVVKYELDELIVLRRIKQASNKARGVAKVFHVRLT